MQDRTPLYPGRVKLIPVEGQENTYDMVRADEPTQEGDPMSKATFLKDATAALFGLGSDAVPDDALALLAQFRKEIGNEYVWEKTKDETFDVVSSKNEFWQNLTIYQDYSGSLPQMRDLTYGKSAKIVDGAVALDEVFTPTSQPTSDNASYWKILVPFYFKYNGKVYYADAYVGANSNNVAVSAYYTAVVQKTVVTSYGYVNSPDPNAYPPAVPDGYTYTPLGQVGNKVRIETGSYTGTGTYGSSNPNILTFDFEPKLLIVIGYFDDSGNYTAISSLTNNAPRNMISSDILSTAYVYGAGLGLYDSGVPYGKKSSDGRTIYWYHGVSAKGQLNISGYTYIHIAIG